MPYTELDQAIDTVIDYAIDGKLTENQRRNLINALNRQIKQERQKKKWTALDAYRADRSMVFVTAGLRRHNGVKVRIIRVLKTRAEVEVVGSYNPWPGSIGVKVPLSCLAPEQEG